MNRTPRRQFRRSGPGSRPEGPKQFDQLQATELYCPRCKQAMPVRERLLLVLPEGDKYEYLCARCGESVGDRIVKDEKDSMLVLS
jgi:DNA-directed RNA polymerase subunit RPC12/RpoP